MIVPIRMKIERRGDEGTSFVEDYADFARPGKVTYRVEATALDTESRKTRTYAFHSMVDRNKDDYENVGFVQVGPMDVGYLRRLRDELNKLLEEESKVYLVYDNLSAYEPSDLKGIFKTREGAQAYIDSRLDVLSGDLLERVSDRLYIEEEEIR